jgi:ABC-type nitrate/sulfonate/bicarbonate transport system ATPase subunit
MITNSVEEALLLSDRILPMTAGPRATLGAAGGCASSPSRDRPANCCATITPPTSARTSWRRLTEDLERSRAASIRPAAL